MSYAAFIYLYISCVFLITASFSYSMRIQMEIVYTGYKNQNCPGPTTTNQSPNMSSIRIITAGVYCLLSFSCLQLRVLRLPSLLVAFKDSRRLTKTVQTLVELEMTVISHIHFQCICGLVCPRPWLSVFCPLQLPSSLDCFLLVQGFD